MVVFKKCLFIFYLFVLLVNVRAKKKKSKDWSKIDLEKVEEEWKQGDSEDELITGDELLFREMEKRKEQSIDVDGPLDPEVIRHQQSSSGPAMMFIELELKAGGYGETELVDLGGVWKDLLFSGGVDAKFYNIEENRMLVSLQKGWDAKNVKDFLLEQDQVVKVTWDSIDYYQNERRAPQEKETQEPQRIKKGKKKSKIEQKK
jgi:hypothetical protein